MKIIHITPDLNFAIKFVVPIAEHQAATGAEVIIISDSNEYHTSDINFELVCAQYKLIKFIRLNIKINFNLLDYLKSMTCLARRLKINAPDVVISHTSLDSFIPLLISRFSTNSKLVYFNHGVPFLGYNFPLQIILKFIEFINMRIAHLTLTISETMREYLAPLAPKNKAANFIPPGSACGINVITYDYEKVVRLRAEARQALGISNDERIVIYVGRPVRRKGFFDLLAAWDLLKNLSNYRLILVGPADFDRLKLDNTFPSNVHFLGYKSDPTIFYLVADVLCIPSHHEGLGYCYIEASAAGCVPICAKIPGPTDFVKHDLNGITCQAGDIYSIAESISLVLNDAELRDRLARNAFLQASSFDRTVLAPKVCSAIDQY